MKRAWATGEVKRVRGVHCVRLDDETHQIAKNLSEKYYMTIKDIIKLALTEHEWDRDAET